jgi:hypothetical protein
MEEGRPEENQHEPGRRPGRFWNGFAGDALERWVTFPPGVMHALSLTQRSWFGQGLVGVCWMKKKIETIEGRDQRICHGPIAKWPLANRRINQGAGGVHGKGRPPKMDVSWGHELDRFGVPASAGRASVAWGAGNFSSAGFSFPTPSTFDPWPPKGGTPNGAGSWEEDTPKMWT